MLRLAIEAIRAAQPMPDVELSLCVSRQNDNFAALTALGEAAIGVDTFEHGIGAVLGAWRIPSIRKVLAAEIRRRRIGVVIELMPHVWSPFLTSQLRMGGARYATIVHDAGAHPGDPTALVNSILGLAAARADRVITLSEAVTAQLRANGRIASEKIVTLFHPDLNYGPLPDRPPREPETPLRLVFLGRILPYKGLGLFVDAIEALRGGGIAVEVGVFGEGHLNAEGGRLEALGAEIINRWLSDDEIASILARYDVMVVSHVEASQSGVVAAAFGAGLPVVATPVGALPEQVEHGVAGLVADAVSAEALAAVTKRLALDRELYRALCEGVRARRDLRSVQRFVRECVRLADE